jgi:phosphatidylserine/phosphatidylglycerophosphate/cardiolipin synthase-like enzyme
MKSNARALLSTLVIALGAACGDAGGSQTDDATDVVAVEGSPEARAMLALVNDVDVGVTELDVAAKLTSTAAKNIISRRDGADKKPGTADDNRYDTLAELDAVSGVGEATLRALLTYATANGYLDDRSIDVVFSPQAAWGDSHLARVAELIDDAQSTIDVAMYSFSDATIGAALKNAVARGVKVRFLFDTASEDRKLTGSAAASSKSGGLEQAGVDVRYVNKIMHHKFVIVDGPRDDAARAETAWVASGSANWSNSAATRYDENTLFLRGYAEIVLRLQRDFDLMWDHSRDFALASPLPWEHASLQITDDMIVDEPSMHAFFTSANFKVSGDTFSIKGSNEVSDALVQAIGAAKKSIHIASGHLRSRPVAEALMAKAADTSVEILVYLDGQEYIASSTNTIQENDLEDCLEAAGTSESKRRACIDKGFLFGLNVDRAGVAVRYKYYAYRWDASYAKQMHDKYFVFDGERLFTGSYNLSDNAEHQTFENLLVFEGSEFADLVAKYEANFASIWETGRAEKRLDTLTSTVKTAQTIPLVFEPMALEWSEVTTLKSLIRSNCALADSTEYRENAPAHQTCPR